MIPRPPLALLSLHCLAGGLMALCSCGDPRLQWAFDPPRLHLQLEDPEGLLPRVQRLRVRVTLDDQVFKPAYVTRAQSDLQEFSLLLPAPPRGEQALGLDIEGLDRDGAEFCLESAAHHQGTTAEFKRGYQTIQLRLGSIPRRCTVQITPTKAPGMASAGTVRASQRGTQLLCPPSCLSEELLADQDLSLELRPDPRAYAFGWEISTLDGDSVPCTEDARQGRCTLALSKARLRAPLRVQAVAAAKVCTGPWCWEHPLPQGNSLNAVHVQGKSVWAVGDRGMVLFFNGRTWQHVPTGIDNDLYAVYADAAGRVFIAGQALAGRPFYCLDSGVQPWAFRPCGPQNANDAPEVRALAGFEQGGELVVLAVGAKGSPTTGAVARYDARACGGVGCFQPLGSYGTQRLRGVTLRSLTEAYAVDEGGNLWRGDLTRSPAFTTMVQDPQKRSLYAVLSRQGKQGPEVWAVGQSGALVVVRNDKPEFPALPKGRKDTLYTVGHAMGQVLLGGADAGGQGQAYLFSDAEEVLRWLTDPDKEKKLVLPRAINGVAAGDAGFTLVGVAGALYQGPADKLAPFVAAQTYEDVRALYASGGEAWAVTKDGSILHGDGLAPFRPEWQTPGRNYTAIAGLDRNNIVAIGRPGVLQERRILDPGGAAWPDADRAPAVQTAQPELYAGAAQLGAIYAAGTAAGKSSLLRRGGRFDTVAGADGLVMTGLSALCPAGGASLWAAGDSGKVLQLNLGSDPVQVADETVGGTPNLNAILAQSDLILVGGERGVYRRVSKNQWQAETLPDRDGAFLGKVYALWGAPMRDAFAGGTGGKLWRRSSNGSWSEEQSGVSASWTVYGLFGTDEDLFAVGSGGMILRRRLP